MSALDVSRLSPEDAVAALRSYPRRFRELFGTIDEEDVPAEAIEQADHVARSLALLGEALRQVLVHDQPTLMPAVADDRVREWAHSGASSLRDVLTFLTVESNALADAVSEATTDGWTRTGTVAGSTGGTMSALDLVREAVRTGADGLRAAERALRT
jgi:hypothetical protein